MKDSRLIDLYPDAALLHLLRSLLIDVREVLQPQGCFIPPPPYLAQHVLVLALRSVPTKGEVQQHPALHPVHEERAGMHLRAQASARTEADRGGKHRTVALAAVGLPQNAPK